LCVLVPLTITCGSQMSRKHDKCHSLPIQEPEQEEAIAPAIRHTRVTAAWGRLGVEVFASSS
jgi:hypothetical protein